MQVWPAEGPPRGLGYSVIMVGHGISIQSSGILGFLFTLFSIVRPKSRLANNDSSESSEVVNLDDSEMWLRVCSQRVELFQRAMLTTFENLAIA